MLSVCLPMPPFYFQDFVSSLSSLICILFQVDYLVLLHLFGLWVFTVFFICFMFLGLFILFKLLCLGSHFCRLEDGSSA